MGPEGDGIDDEARGIIPRMMGSIFSAIEEADTAVEFTVKVSFVEIYLDRVRDLLNPDSVSLKLREEKGGSVMIEGAREAYCICEEDMLSVMQEGSVNRAVSSTKMNEDSSRSHSVFTITILQKNTTTQSSKVGKLSLVDLAGSEMVKKTAAS